MSASQHTIAHACESTSEIHPNGLCNPAGNPHQHHRYENITLDLLESDALSVLPSNLKAIALLGAGLANCDNRDARYRTFYLRQGWAAQHLGLSRQTLAGNLGIMVEHGLLIKLGKGHPRNRRKGAQPVIFYAIPEFGDLCRVAATKTKADFTRKKSPADIARIVNNADVDNSAQIVDNSKKVSTTDLQPPDNKVSSGRDTLLSNGRDTLTERLSSGRDTKIDLLHEIDKGKGKGVHPSENEDNKTTNINTDVNGNVNTNTNGQSAADDSAADEPGGRSEPEPSPSLLCPCGNAIPAEKWAAGREVCRACWEQEQRAAHAVWKKEREEERRRLEEEYRAYFREKWAHLDKGKRADRRWTGADFATRGTAGGLSAAAD